MDQQFTFIPPYVSYNSYPPCASYFSVAVLYDLNCVGSLQNPLRLTKVQGANITICSFSFAASYHKVNIGQRIFYTLLYFLICLSESEAFVSGHSVIQLCIIMQGLEKCLGRQQQLSSVRNKSFVGYSQLDKSRASLLFSSRSLGLTMSDSKQIEVKGSPLHCLFACVE